MAFVSQADWPEARTRFHDSAARRVDIDTLRAIACIALVSYHVVGSGPASGLELAPDHWLAVLNRVPIDLRMPLFSFLSGMVFVVARDGGGAGGRLAAKARRLLLPMIAVGVLFWMTRAAMGIDQAPLWSLPVLPYEHFWFLQATFLIMAAMTGLTLLLGGRDVGAALWIMGGATLWWLFGARATPDVLSINGAVKLAPFFAAGYLAVRIRSLWSVRRRQSGAEPVRRWQGLALLAAVLAAGSILAVLPETGSIWRRGLALGVGGAGCLALVLIRPRSEVLAALGRQSYAIYLFHVFFTAGMREVLLAVDPALGPESLWLPGLAAGLAGPVLVAWLALRHSMASTLLLGIAPARARTARSISTSAILS